MNFKNFSVFLLQSPRCHNSPSHLLIIWKFRTNQRECFEDWYWNRHDWSCGFKRRRCGRATGGQRWTSASECWVGSQGTAFWGKIPRHKRSFYKNYKSDISWISWYVDPDIHSDSHLFLASSCFMCQHSAPQKLPRKHLWGVLWCSTASDF